MFSINKIADFLLINVLCFRLGLCFILLNVLNFYSAKAQILDDSTKQVYSSKTTKYVLEEDFLNGDYLVQKTDSTLKIMGAKNSIDTSFSGFHNYSFLFRGTQPAQDLGNYLSPIQPIYFQQTTQIGKQFGYTAFDIYTIPSNKIKYYDTKSPYSQLNYKQGGIGQQGMEVDLSRNILPNWNIGFDLRRQTSKKILASNNGVGGKQKALESSDYFFAAYTRFYTKNERYQLLANLNHGHQIYFNNGGIKPTAKDSIVSENFSYQLASSYLSNARTIDKRINYHLYQEYHLLKNKTIQIYTITDYTRRTFRFNNKLASTDNKTFLADTLFYNTAPLVNPTLGGLKQQFNFTMLNLNDRTDFNDFENQIGIKAKQGKLDYRFFVRRRDFSVQQLNYAKDSLLFSKDSISFLNADTIPTNSKYSENFVGARLRYSFQPNSQLIFDGEYMLGRDYRYKIEFINKYLKLGYSKIFHSPTLAQLEHRSNVRSMTWKNIDNEGNIKFLNPQLDKFYFNTAISSPKHFLSIGVSYEINRNLVYFDNQAKPRQANQTLNFLTADLSAGLSVWKFHVETFWKYTHQNIDSFWVVPKLFNKNRLYFQSNIYNKAALLQLGVDTYWRSTYLGASYMPVTQQFYKNDSFELKSFLQVDVFLNVQIKYATLFFKYAYINKGPNGGYFITPGYTAIPNSFDFGIRWMFFD
ncbi:MAG: hypothetical protein EAZ07_07990 [Cytophagales bacterium]|nr:MAG: hypothetical protein EAZ07_07990 [Cytophagales bacterium]